MSSDQVSVGRGGDARKNIGCGVVVALLLVGVFWMWWTDRQNTLRPLRDQQAVETACRTAITARLGDVAVQPDTHPLDMGDRWLWTSTARGSQVNRVLCVMASPTAAPELVVGDENGKTR